MASSQRASLLNAHTRTMLSHTLSSKIPSRVLPNLATAPASHLSTATLRSHPLPASSLMPRLRTNWTDRTSTGRSMSAAVSVLDDFQMFASLRTDDGPRVHVTRGLTPEPLQPHVSDAMQAYVQSLTSSQHSTEIPRDRPVSLESFHVMDLSRVKTKHAKWVEAMPTIQPFYAVKSNPHPSLVGYLNELGTGFDCASKAELELVISLGANPENILFAHPCKSPADILAAKNLGIKRTTFDSEAELVKIQRLYPEMELVLRIWVDDSQAQCQLSNKYGAVRDEWQRLMSLARVLNLNVVGISFHVGSGGQADTYAGALRDAREAWAIAESHGHKMSILDIGGGFPGIEDPTQPGKFQACADIINPALASFPSNVRVIAEPGRYFSAESQTLVTMVIAKRERKGQPIYFVGDGVYQSFNCMMYDHSQLLDNVSDPHEAQALRTVGQFPSAVFGQTCDGIDQIASNLALPPLDVGDWLAFPGMGAYTTAASSRFNGFGTPSVLVLPPQ